VHGEWAFPLGGWEKHNTGEGSVQRSGGRGGEPIRRKWLGKDC
jgi:hypothetical protein